jgi:cell division protein FtsQ
MDRSLAARLARPFGIAGGPASSARQRSGASAGARPRPGRPAIRHPRVTPRLGGLGRTVRGAVASVWGRRRARLALLAVLIALPVLGGGWLLLRHSSFVAVQRVRISGVHGPQATAIDAALLAAAHRMSTLDVNTAALRAAVAPFRLVRELHAIPSFPHGLRIEVVESLPVATLLAGGVRTAVAADGVVLGPGMLSSSLPTLSVANEPAAGARVSSPPLLESLAVLGAAPASLGRFITSVTQGPRGLTIGMRDGLSIYFGNAYRPHAKWISLARVLADPSSAGASYVDVRLPSRPAAGFPGGVAPNAAGASGTGASPSTSELATSSESTIAALAAGLSAGTGAGSASTTTQPSEPASGTSASGSGETESGSSPAAGSTTSERGSEAGSTSGAGGAQGGEPPTG